eukprot:74147_1
MGTKHPKECMNEQAKNDISANTGLKTYPSLLKMGYHWSLAYQAAQLYPNNIDDAINWIASKMGPLKSESSRREKIERTKWTVGSKCKIFSGSLNKWVIGTIVKIQNGNDGEWLTVQYDGTIRTKQVQRNYQGVKPIPSVKSEDKTEKVTFKVSVGIDFGTDGLGLAYSIKGSDGKSK